MTQQNYPSFQGIDVIYRSQADNKDIRDLLVKLVPKAKAQMLEFSQQFKGRTEKETCKKIFDYIKSNFSYVADAGEQVIKLPSALLRKRIGDCKSYSLFTASILENLKIPYKFVYTSYNNNPIPSHVYVVTENGCIIDAVYGIFNAEKKPTYKYIHNMNVRYMAGIGANCTSCNQGIGRDGRGRAKVKEAKKEVVGKFKTAAFVGGRAVFLVLIKGNFDGIANKLQKVDTNKLKKDWERVGGDYSALTKAIKFGASKPAKKLGLLGKLKSLLKKKGIQGIGAVDTTAVQAAIVAVATAVGSAIPAAGTAAGASVGAVLAELYPTMLELVKQTPASEEDPNVPNVPTTESTPENSTSFNFGSILPIIAVGGAIYYFATKKK